MKLLQVLVFATLVLFTAIGAHADGVSTDDARIIVGGDPPLGNCHTNGLGTFKFRIHANGGGLLANCVNTTNVDWIGLEITGMTKISNDNIGFGGKQGSFPFACNGEPTPEKVFSTCTIISQNKHLVTFTLTDGRIPPGDISPFSLALSDDGDPQGSRPGGWEGNLEVTPIVATPEPGAFALVLMGLIGIWIWRSRKALNARA